MLIFGLMNENLDPTDSNFTNEEVELDKALRPLSFDDSAGQDQILDNLNYLCDKPLKCKKSESEDLLIDDKINFVIQINGKSPAKI